MKLEIVTMRIIDDTDEEFRISTVDVDNEPLDTGVFRLSDQDGDNALYVTEGTIRAFLRAAEAVKTGVLLD